MNGDRPITEDDLQAYIDEVLDSRRRGEVETYLAAKPEMAKRIATDIEMRSALRAALLPIADEPVPAELNLSRLIERRERPVRARWSGPWQVAATLVLILAAGGGGWTLRSAQEPPSAGINALAREAADSYAVYAPDMGRPVEIQAADSHQLLSWVSQRLDRPMSIPDLSASGFRLIGGRVVPTPHGPAALYMFENASGTRLTLLSRNMTVDRDAPMSFDNSGQVTSVSWARNGLGFSLVGPLDRSALHPIADAARMQLDHTI